MSDARRPGAGTGLRALRAGIGFWVTSPRVMLLGAIPAAVVSLLYVALLAVLVGWTPTIAEAVTPFADDWSPGWRTTVRVAAGVAVAIAGIALAAATFTAVTVTVGDPLYERIRAHVDDRLGDAPPEPSTGVLAGFWRGVKSGVRLLGVSVVLAIVTFAIGLVPLVGGVAAFVVGAIGGGWLLARELTGWASDARDLPHGTRLAMLRGARGAALGYGVPVHLLFLVPLGAVVFMPAAVAGATVLVRALTPTAPAAPTAPTT